MTVVNGIKIEKRSQKLKLLRLFRFSWSALTLSMYWIMSSNGVGVIINIEEYCKHIHPEMVFRYLITEYY